MPITRIWQPISAVIALFFPIHMSKFQFEMLSRPFKRPYLLFVSNFARKVDFALFPLVVSLKNVVMERNHCIWIHHRLLARPY